jgi:zinc protease
MESPMLGLHHETGIERLKEGMKVMASITVRILVGVLLLIAAGLPAFAQQQLKVVMEDFTLANGLRVVVLPNTRAPLVTHSIWYRVGSADEVAGKTGLAHFLEHLVFKGTPKFPRGKFDKLMKANGAYSNAITTRDYTYFFQRIGSDKLALVMEMEADRMKNLVLTEADVVPERDVVRQERLQRIENDPTGPFWEKITAVIYGDHPYGVPTIGYMPDVEGLTLQDALGLYRTYYQPGNAVVVIAGNVDVAQTRILAEKFYGVLRNDNAIPPRKDVAKVVSKPAETRFELTDGRVQSPYVVANYLVPSVLDPAADEALALSFFGEIFASGLESRLGKSLVLGSKIASATGYSFNNDTRGPGNFVLYGVPNPGKGLKELETALQAELGRVLKEGVTQDELDRVLRRAFGNLVYEYDSPDGFMRLAGTRAMLDGNILEAFDTSDWKDITPVKINAAARKHLAQGKGITAFLSRNAADMNGAAKP